MKIDVKEDLIGLLYTRGKREGKKIQQLVNELLGQALWNEPDVLFKGKHYRVEPDLFGSFKPPEPSEN